jgi:hypothetical protein
MHKRFIIQVIIVFFSVCIIDGGKNIIHLSKDIEILLSISHSTDLEIPHQNQLKHFYEDVKWIKTHEFDFSCFNLKPLKFIITQNFAIQEFSINIWQPPKFV